MRGNFNAAWLLLQPDLKSQWPDLKQLKFDLKALIDIGHLEPDLVAYSMVHRNPFEYDQIVVFVNLKVFHWSHGFEQFLFLLLNLFII